MEIGTSMVLDGKTVRGKNRIRRGGRTWMVASTGFGGWLLMQSIQKPTEMFWMHSTDDDNNKRMNGQ